MRRLTGLLALMTLTAACSTSNYAFRIDESIEFIEPAARSEVPLPLTLRWTDDEQPSGMRVDPRDPRAQYYAVFVDRAALAPGKRLSSLVDDTTPCDPAQGCPTPEQLDDLDVYLVAAPMLQLDFLADLRPTSRGDSKDVHEVTVVRMRGAERIGEPAFLQTFFVRR